MPNGEEGELTPSEFANQYESLLKQGAKFDFSKSATQGFYDSDWKNILELSPTFSTKFRQMWSAD